MWDWQELYSNYTYFSTDYGNQTYDLPIFFLFLKHLSLWVTFIISSLTFQAYVNLLFWYQFFCGFSGTSMTDYWILIFFNLLFTSVPPIVYGVLDKDVSAEILMQIPQLYVMSQKSVVG